MLDSFPQQNLRSTGKKTFGYNITGSIKKEVKQGILITAYKNASQLLDLIQALRGNYKFYIHIDKKSKISESEIEQIRKSANVVFVSRKYKINWGGLNHLKSILLLCEEVIRDKEIEYVHLISGQDYPTKTNEHINSFLEANRGKEYLNYETPPEPTELARLMNYSFFDLINGRSKRGETMIYWISMIQKKLGIKRKVPMGDASLLYIGSTWWTLSAECVRYVMKYTKEQPAFFKRMKFTFCSEEYYFQSVIMNSPFRENVINNNLRYIVWQTRNGSLPAILDESDYEKIVNSDVFFARKFDLPVSANLLKKIKQANEAVTV
jgi:hypothetical protein